MLLVLRSAREGALLLTQLIPRSGSLALFFEYVLFEKHAPVQAHPLVVLALRIAAAKDAFAP